MTGSWGVPRLCRRSAAIRSIAALAMVGAIAAACGGDGGTPRAEGVVVDVDGDLLEVRSFVLITDDGERLTFVPREGLRFRDGSPLSHLQEHATFGTAIVVDYEDDGSGTLVAIDLRDR